MKEKAKLFPVKRRLLQMTYSDRRYSFLSENPHRFSIFFWFSILSVTFVVLFVV